MGCTVTELESQTRMEEGQLGSREHRLHCVPWLLCWDPLWRRERRQTNVGGSQLPSSGRPAGCVGSTDLLSPRLRPLG